MHALPVALAWIAGLLAAGCNQDDHSCPIVARSVVRVCQARPDLSPTTSAATTDGTSSEGSSSDGSSGTDETGTTTNGTSGGTTTTTTGGEDPTSVCAGLMPGGEVVGGPYLEDDQCCFDVEPDIGDEGSDGSGGTVCGRPFLVEGVARVAAIIDGAAWVLTCSPDLHGLTSAQRDALAAAWLADATAEHASIAAFARFTSQLLAVGAPAELVADAVQAGADEVEHARLCFGLAAAYAGQPRSAGPFELPSMVATDLLDIILATFIEGCIGETTAAVLAAVAATHSLDPVVRHTWQRIAADEGRHAALAWRFVTWALSRQPDRVRPALGAAALGAVLADLRRGPTMNPGYQPALPGRLSVAEQIAVAKAVRREVVVPQLRRLLSAGGGVLEENHAGRGELHGSRDEICTRTEVHASGA